MGKWSFLTNHAAAMVCIAHDPGVRLRDIAATLDITERSAFGIVTELVGAGYVVKEKDGRRNRYSIQGHLPMRDSVARERTIGEILAVLVKDGALTNTDHPSGEPAASTRRLLKLGDPPDKAAGTA
jgi:predicted transcriptional regulator